MNEYLILCRAISNTPRRMAMHLYPIDAARINKLTDWSRKNPPVPGIKLNDYWSAMEAAWLANSNTGLISWTDTIFAVTQIGWCIYGPASKPLRIGRRKY
jgi:hypothetical protein